MTVPRHAFLLAAGLGQRLRPLTDQVPKPLVEVAGKPLIQWHIEKLREIGIRRLVINAHWLGEQLQERLGDGTALGVEIHWSPEPQLLNTGGGIRAALPLLDATAPFALISADCWTAADFRWLADADLQHSVARLMLVPNPDFHPGGDFCLDGEGRLHGLGGPGRSLTYSGIALLDPAWVADWEDTGPAFPLVAPLARAVARGRVSGFLYQGQWTDVGTAERLARLRSQLAAEHPVAGVFEVPLPPR